MSESTKVHNEQPAVDDRLAKALAAWKLWQRSHLPCKACVLQFISYHFGLGYWFRRNSSTGRWYTVFSEEAFKNLDIYNRQLAAVRAAVIMKAQGIACDRIIKRVGEILYR